MIKKHYSGSARRARNIIWNAAGNYDFEPVFLAFFPNGAPDNYFNMIVGLAEKWIGSERLSDFFLRYEYDRRRDEFDDFLWLGLENYLYEKELPDRPVLASLRKERAERFFKEQQSLSRQQMAYQSVPVYNQQEYRWARVLGRRAPLLTPKEKRIAEALAFSGSLDAEGVIEAMGRFLEEFFHFRLSDAPAASSLHRAGGIAKRLLRREHKHVDRLIVRAGTGEGDHAKAVQQRHEGLGRILAPEEADEAYIRAVFGESFLTGAERRLLENDLCTGIDGNCRLWVTKTAELPSQKGSLSAEISGKDAKEIAEAGDDIHQQRERNREAYARNAAVIRHTIKDLTTRIDTVLSSYLKHMPEPARRGRIRPEAAYRLPLLNDDRVFLKDGDETEPEICVDLLLDASQSRMHSQEIIASEAYIIAESLRALRIPVRLTAFRSLRGYTVIEVLKDWNDKDTGGVFRYYAGGWNRDALALKALARLEDNSLQGRQRMVLVLTDASPNDSTPMAGEGLRLSREYEGAAAVKAAEEAVRGLRHDGLKVGAVFHGNTGHLADLHQIYGHTCVRIRTLSQLAQGVSDLLLMLLRENRTD